MIKKITIAVLLTLMILAFPVRIFSLSEKLELVIKVVKGIVFIALMIFLIKREGLFRRKILHKKLSLKTIINLAPVILLVFCYLAYSLTKSPPEINSAYDYILLTLLASFVAAASEEIVFRGYIFNVLNKENHSLLKNIIISSLIFALTHMINIFRYADVWSVINQIVFALALGMLFGSIYTLTRNLLAVSILHFFVNVPSAIDRTIDSTRPEVVIADSGLIDNLISLIFMVALMLPFITLAMYYIRLAGRQNGMHEKDNLTLIKDQLRR